MSIDPKGTAPGLTTKDEPEEANMSCPVRTCDSITVTVMKIGAATGSPVYRCTKCGYTRAVAVGGAVNW